MSKTNNTIQRSTPKSAFQQQKIKELRLQIETSGRMRPLVKFYPEADLAESRSSLNFDTIEELRDKPSPAAGG